MDSRFPEGRQVFHSKRVIVEKAAHLPLVIGLRLDIELDKLNPNPILSDSALLFCEMGNCRGRHCLGRMEKRIRGRSARIVGVWSEAGLPPALSWKNLGARARAPGSISLSGWPVISRIRFMVVLGDFQWRGSV
jgi:hypothetical protein